MPQSDDEGVGPICLKLLPKLIQDLVELGQVSRPDSLGQEEVGHERALEGWLSELQPVRDLPQQQLHHNQQLVHRLFEADSCVLRALRRALVIVLRASEYSSWMALIRPV